MNTGPLAWLFVLAPATVLGALLFVWVYQSNSSTADLERERMRLESQEFDRTATAAWNGQPLQEPSMEDIEKLRSRINAKQKAIDADAAERCRTMERIAAGLDATLQGHGGSAEPKKANQTCELETKK